ncbi:MAG: BON domain-containing protein [Planctomycetota bacterium]
MRGARAVGIALILGLGAACGHPRLEPPPAAAEAETRDARLAAGIERALFDAGVASWSRIRVSANAATGRVELRGEVADADERDRVESLVAARPGVRELRTELRVAP